MGYTWEVRVWMEVIGEGYQYLTWYEGPSLFAAIRHMLAAKREGHLCITLVWRP